MTPLVVDTSVVVKLFVPEEFSDIAPRVLAPDYQLHAPHHAAAEFGNVLWKLVRRGTLEFEQVTNALERRARMAVTLHDIPGILDDALALAHEHDRTVYDALYVVLARRLEAPFVTADRRLYNALVTHYPETMLWIEDVPEDAPED